MINNLKTQLKQSNFGLKMIYMYHKIKFDYLENSSVEEFAQKKYKNINSRYLDLKNPTTFDEKLWWLKINYRDNKIIDCTDKIKVQEYVKSKGLNHILNKPIAIYDNANEIIWEDLPQEFFFKTNHSSGTNIHIKNKNKVDKDYMTKRLNLFLKKDHYILSKEWNYKDIERKILAEKAIDFDDYLLEYKFFCSYGEMKGYFMQFDEDVITDQNKDLSTIRRNLYNSKHELLDVQFDDKKGFNEKKIKKPEHLEEMVKYAEILSEDFPSCRVDFYSNKGKIIFGEITFFHRGGINDIKPIEYQEILGDWIGLPIDLKL